MNEKRIGKQSGWVMFARSLATIGIWTVSGYVVTSGITAWIFVATIIGTLAIWND